MQETRWKVKFWLPAKLNYEEFVKLFKEHFPKGRAVYFGRETPQGKHKLLFHPATEKVRRQRLVDLSQPLSHVFVLYVSQEETQYLTEFLYAYLGMNGVVSNIDPPTPTQSPYRRQTSR